MAEKSSPSLSPLARRIGYAFHDEALLQQALTHRSAGSRNNERLEFLGDAVLSLVIADALYQLKPDFAEGELSRTRASLVRGETLARVAQEIELGEYLNLGVGELKSGGFERGSILSDCVEAIIGAVYLEGGYASARAVILKLFDSRLRDLPDVELMKDPKTRLQEALQGQALGLPEYEVLEKSGKSHEQVFRVVAASGNYRLSRRRPRSAAARQSNSRPLTCSL